MLGYVNYGVGLWEILGVDGMCFLWFQLFGGIWCVDRISVGMEGNVMQEGRELHRKQFEL